MSRKIHEVGKFEEKKIWLFRSAVYFIEIYIIRHEIPHFVTVAQICHVTHDVTRMSRDLTGDYTGSSWTVRNLYIFDIYK